MFSAPTTSAHMDKFLITRKSENTHTGPIMVTTSPRVTCPTACPFRKGAGTATDGLCYAEHGAIGGFLWTLLDRARPGDHIMNRVRIYSFDELLYIVRRLPPGTLWRHNAAGDLISNNKSTIDGAALRALVDANKGRRGFTFTHYDTLTNLANREAIRHANENGFTVNLSANSIDHAEKLVDLRIAPVTTILPATVHKNLRTRKGRTVVICPTYTHTGVTCATCGLCSRQRSTIVGFPAIGGQKHTAT